MVDRLRLRRDATALLVIDIQERLCAAMEPAALARMVARSRALIDGAAALGLPAATSEQYPQGLGPTIEPIRVALGERFRPVEKVQFSACLLPILEALGARSHVLVCGMETHVCVFQTVRDLAARGVVPHVCADAVISRTAEDRRVGLELCAAAGGVVTTVEAALFDLLERAGTPEFKRASAAVK
jgi:nicotinamidase-related amidase